MFEFTWPWIFLLAPLPWLMRRLLPPADSGEAVLQVSFLNDLESLAGRRARCRRTGVRTGCSATAAGSGVGIEYRHVSVK